MDRDEYQELLKQIRKYDEEGKYKSAAELVRQINWKRVRSASSLCLAGTVMGKAGQYEEGKELLLMAYDRSPIGRTIIYELADLCIRQGDLNEAEEYYREFIDVAPRDSKRYELRYAIDKARGASADALISVLESLKERDFSEKWSYELAHMYYKAGHADQCIALCDEIILWFGEGEYVEKALELKMLYQPLSGNQKRLYEEIKMKKDGYIRVAPDDVRSSGEILHNEVTIPTINTDLNKYNTMNLQDELAKSMRQIMEATERETVTTTMDEVRRLVADNIPSLETVETPQELYQNIETEEEIDESMNQNFQMLLAEENDGQMTLFPSGSDPMVDQQITGQISIEDILAGWEKTKRAAEVAMEDAKLRRLESAKQRALAETGNLIDKIAEVQAIAAEMEAITAGEALNETGSEVAEILNNITPDTEETEDEILELEEEERRTITEVFAEKRLAEEQEREKAHKWDTLSLEFLTPEEEEIFSYFMPVNGMEKQICAVLQGVKSRKLDSTSSAGNVAIEGPVRGGKTVLATNIIKVLQTNDPDNVPKVGRISGDKLNEKDVDHIVQTIKGGYLIIERAGKMTQDTAFRLNNALAKDTDNLLVFMEDTRKGLMETGDKCPALLEKFTEKIMIPVFTVDELVNFGKSYAKESGYCFEQMSTLALYKAIANIDHINENTTLNEVMEIVNAAIENSKKHKLSARREDGLIVLKEKDVPL